MFAPARYAPSDVADAARVNAARWAVLGLFAVAGAFLSVFLSRLPSVRDLLQVSAAELATLLIAGAAGALVALTVTGWCAARFGTRALLWWSSVGHLTALTVVGISTAVGSPWLFAAGHFFVSMSFAFANVAMNTEAAAVERRMDRPVMSQFHAAFSVGMAVSLAAGAGLSHLGVAPVWHFAGVAAALTLVRLAIIPAAVVDGRPEPVSTASLGGPFATARAEFRDRRVVLIGVVVFAAAMTEMTAAQWMALTVVDDFSRSEAVGDLVYWVFVVAMVTVRWTGAAIIGRVGRVVTLRISAGLVVAGLLLFAFSPVFWLIPVGAMLWGLGAALGNPIGMSAAADDPGRAAARVAAVASFGTIAGLMVPQLIGRLAEVTDLRLALLVVAVASATSFLLARAVRQQGPLFRSHRGLAQKDLAQRSMAQRAATGAPDSTLEP